MSETPESETTPVVDELEVHNGEPLRPTFFDANGVERIAGPPVEAWKPAQVDPTDEQIATNEAYHAREAARRDEATALLSQPTSEPLLEANRAYHDELDAAGDGTTDVTPVGDPGDPAAPPVVSEPATPTPAVPDNPPAPVEPGQTDQQAVDAAAVADADANVAAQVEAERAQAAEASAQADDAALTAAEAQQVHDEEASS